MSFYMRIEIYKNGIFTGKGVTVFEASGLVDAMRKAADAIEGNPGTLHSDHLTRGHETRITIGPDLKVEEPKVQP